MTNETKIILGSTIGTILTTAIGLAVLITTLFVNLGSRIEALREDMREDYQRLDERMRTVEQGFAKIDQRARDTRARSNPRGRTRRITDPRHGEGTLAVRAPASRHPHASAPARAAFVVRPPASR